MNALAHGAVYGAVLVFLAAVAVRYWRIRRLPLNMRWEIYPIPHEGARSAYGGSKLEETDWWKKKHPPSKLTELKFLLPEMILLKALFEHNRRLWWRSFPFHFGLYLLVAFVVLLGLGAGMQLAGLPVDRTATGVGGLVATLTIVVAALGLPLGLTGAAGLFYLRLVDDDLKPYSNPSHYFNLLFVMAVEALGLAVWLSIDPEFALSRAFARDLLTFHFSSPTNAVLLDWTVLAAAVLVAYIPLTHMSHFFVKWFTWHRLRWDDSANVRGGRIEVMIQQALTSPVTWSAPHIAGDGKKTWAQVATEQEARR
jgi:nitrate reductase gamma subunit